MSLFRYRCTDCGRCFDRDTVRYLCPDCGEGYQPGQPLPGVLEVVFDYAHARSRLDPDHPDWEELCAVESAFHPPLVVGDTPLVPAARLAAELGVAELWVKNEGANPSGSLKDRASFLVVAEALRLGETRVVTASTGNAASALAAVCASAGLEAVIFVPASAPRAKLVQMVLYGARVVPVRGSYDDAFALSLRYTAERGGLNRNTAYHPLTIEGKKTAGLELWTQLDHVLPDVVVVPVGDGVILAGLHKAFGGLDRLGLTDRLPRLVGVQAETSDAIDRYVRTGRFAPAAPDTLADSIAVACPSNARWARRAVLDTDGLTVTVSDAEILDAQARLAAGSGVFTEPAGAAAYAGLVRLQATRPLPPECRVVVMATGNGLKDVDAPLERLRLPDPIAPTLAAVPEGGPR